MSARCRRHRPATLAVTGTDLSLPRPSCPRRFYRSPGGVCITCTSKPGAPHCPRGVAWGQRAFLVYSLVGRTRRGGPLTVWLSSSFLSAGLSVWEAAFLLTKEEKIHVSSQVFPTGQVPPLCRTQAVLRASCAGASGILWGVWRGHLVPASLCSVAMPGECPGQKGWAPGDTAIAVCGI